MNELTLRDYLKVLFRQKPVVIVTIITVMITVAIGLKFKTPVYESSVKMLISAQKNVESPFYRDLMGFQNAQLTLTQSEIVKSNPVIERTIKATGIKPLDYEKKYASVIKKPFIDLRIRLIDNKLKKAKPEQRQAYLYRLMVEDLKDNIKVEPVRDTNIFTISLRDFDQIGTAIIANIVSRSYVIFDLEQQLADLQMKYGEKHLAVTQLKDNIEKMIKSLNGQPLSEIEAIGPASVKIIEQASVPLKPAGIAKSFIFVLALFMAVFLSIMLAFGCEYLDQTFRSPQDIETFLNLIYLGSVPQKAKLNDYHDLSDQVYLLMKDACLKTLLVGAVAEKEGATTTIVNLGNYLAEVANYKVLVIDANLRNPSVHKFFKLAQEGLSEVLEEKISFDKAVKEINPNLNVLAAGKTALNPLALLGSHKMQEVIKSAKEKYAIVFIDCPAFNDFKDGLLVSSYVDAVGLVVNEGKTRRQVVKAAIEPLIEKKINIIGVILNNRTFAIPKVIYDRI